jgi:acyl-CoA thioester hydrolase
VLVSTEIAYKKPLVLGDKVRVELWLSDLQNVSATLEFRFFKGDDLAAVGKQRGLFINTVTTRPYRLQPDDRVRFEPYLESAPTT